MVATVSTSTINGIRFDERQTFHGHTWWDVYSETWGNVEIGNISQHLGAEKAFYYEVIAHDEYGDPIEAPLSALELATIAEFVLKIEEQNAGL